MVARIDLVRAATARKDAPLLGRIRVARQREQEQQPHGRLGAPVRLGHFVRQRERGQVSDAEEGKEDGDEGRGCRGLVEFAGMGLRWIGSQRSLDYGVMDGIWWWW